MKNAIIIHGKPTQERYENPELPKPHEANWLPWVSNVLEQKGISTFVPAMPRPYHPNYGAWREELGTARLDKDTGLVGHSAGADFLLHLLSDENQLEVEHLVLVAPWRDKDEKYGDFSKYTLNPSISERVGRISVISSLDDSEPIQTNAHALIAALPGTKLIELNGYGHFMIGNNMTSPEFPELTAELLLN